MNIIIAQGDDWEGIYVDGQLLDQGHSLHLMDVLTELKKLGAEFTDSTTISQREVNLDWINMYGELPRSIDEVVWATIRWESPFSRTQDDSEE